MEDPKTMSLFFELYTASAPPSSSSALESLVLLASLRRSLFSSEDERQARMHYYCASSHVHVRSLCTSIRLSLRQLADARLLYGLSPMGYGLYTECESSYGRPSSTG